ncbi:MAG TPA: hypothetical protein PLY87_24975 [Planctomycetaceae bacterium]|nr:hypothetical protein [Planctomycetaceae bacterium]HQZ68375.1 hypothetical protein [Planctomycetaceae bacterium]
MNTPSVTKSYESAYGKWQFCDWQTEFGILKLNLMGLRAVQADRLAIATGGQESCEWRKAAVWLRRVETDAAKAQELATQARDASLQNDHMLATDLINQACQLEAAWHQSLVWHPLSLAVHAESQSIH